MIQPEQTFFEDPVIDRLLGMVFSLATELQVLRDRVAVTELLLAKKGLIGTAELAAFQPDPAERAALAEDSRAFAAEILNPLLGRQASRSMEHPNAL